MPASEGNNGKPLAKHLPLIAQRLVERCGSQAAAAGEVGVSLRQFIRWLKGENVPRGKSVEKLLQACDRQKIKINGLNGGNGAPWPGIDAARSGIASVRFRFLGRARRNRRKYMVTVEGKGFGNCPFPELPYVGVTDRFRIANNAQLGFAEYGYTGDFRKLDYRRWSDNEIIVRSFEGWPGDSVVIALWDENGRGVTWGGNLRPFPRGAPRINQVKFSGSGKNLKMIICGSGFGEAPRRMPFRGNLDCFEFFDFRSHSKFGSSLFGAGFNGFDRHAPTRVKLRFRSWSDRKIEIDGFSGAYGSDEAVAEVGDPVAVLIWNSAATKEDGPQTAWGGRILPAAGVEHGKLGDKPGRVKNGDGQTPPTNVRSLSPTGLRCLGGMPREERLIRNSAAPRG